jgi:general secretion pathway protein K
MKPQKGIALITILLIVSIITVISAEMAFNHSISISRTANRLNNLHLAHYIYGAEQLTATILKADGRAKEKTDSPKDVWAQSGSMAYPLPNGEFSGDIIDQNGKININDLLLKNKKIDNITIGRLKRLFSILKIDTSLINALLDWIDDDLNATFPKGAEDNYYLSLENPYRVANQAFGSIRELALVNGFDDKIIKKLTPHITALPQRSDININTASSEVLQSLAPHITETIAKGFIDAIKEKPFQSIDDFAKHPSNKGKTLDKKAMNVKSQFFLGQIKVKIGQSSIRSEALFKRDGKNNITILNRTILN